MVDWPKELGALEGRARQKLGSWDLLERQYTASRVESEALAGVLGGFDLELIFFCNKRAGWSA